MDDVYVKVSLFRNLEKKKKRASYPQTSLIPMFYFCHTFIKMI